MEENKNIEIKEFINTEKQIEDSVFDENVEEKIDEDFADIDKDSMKKNYIIVGILYLPSTTSHLAMYLRTVETSVRLILPSPVTSPGMIGV